MDPASGFPQIVGQIFQNMDFDSLIQCRAVSRTFKVFLDDPKIHYIWIRAIEEDQKNYLDKFMDSKPATMEMSEEERKVHRDEWIEVAEIIKEKAPIWNFFRGVGRM